MYELFDALDLSAIDKEVLAFWKEQDIFNKSIEQRDPDHTYVFYEGPPSANGMPGIHHVMARTIKDLFCRYHSMKGERVERKGGWDTHGLPIELSVEKELGITKEDIGGKISVDEYNAKCRETVMRYKDVWDDLTEKMGYWVDLDNPYITYENDYIETVWFLLKRLYDKGLLYKGYTIQPYSPAAGTGLSSHELNMPGAYREIRDVSAVAQFKLKGQDNEYFLAWTTTPWTLPSNTALAVGARITYVKVKTFNRYTQEPITVILAKDRLSAYFSDANPNLEAAEVQPGNKPIPYIEIVDEMTGAELEGMAYEQLMPYVQPDAPAFKVLLGDFVSTEDGTGIVHIAPTFGADDFKVAKKYGIPALLVKDEQGNATPLVDAQGRFVKEVTDFAGRYVKDYGQEEERPVDADIVIKLKNENKLFHSEKYLHNYPHCWRTDKPVLYYPLDSWFIRASSVKERMFELNKTINWKPASTGEGRFGKWLENLQDWNLSRSRYWGIPLPVWRTKDGAHEVCIGSVEELRTAINKANEQLKLSQAVPADLHRPYIDEIVLVASNGAPMYRETDLIDVWFDSGSMPYAQWHYPFENQEIFKRNFPADFIAEGVDQTRGWFYTLHAIAVMAFDSVAFKNVVSNGLVLDKNGVKMSKRLGNAVDPFEAIATYGADAVRWYMITNAQPWDNLKFDMEGLEEVRKKFFRPLFHTYNGIFAQYANLCGFRFEEPEIPLSEREDIDRWIISRLNTLIREVDQDYAQYEPTQAGRKIQVFVDRDLSNWYVRRNRKRFWSKQYGDNEVAAYQTLYECLLKVAQLMAPIAPFFPEWLFKNLNAVTGKASQPSIHLLDFPVVNEQAIDPLLEERMDYAQRVASLVFSLRKNEGINVRQPLQKILLPVLNEQFMGQIDRVKDQILSEVNVKEIEYLTDTTGILKKRIKPNFKTLGKRLGKHMKAASQLIAELDQEAIAAIEKQGVYQMHIEGQDYELLLEDFDITTDDIPGWLVANDGPLTVALDVTITDDLKAEGTARELVNRIQNLRKEKDFNLTDHIGITLTEHPAIAPAILKFGDFIQQETLADALAMIPGFTEGDTIVLPEAGELYVAIAVL
ncbi:MAG: isoleucine--tRNA ligase [Saprospiraceae bacterium]|nr:isoleucine--tRNA ligase [Saprospiraceae bacterium]